MGDSRLSDSSLPTPSLATPRRSTQQPLSSYHLPPLPLPPSPGASSSPTYRPSPSPRTPVGARQEPSSSIFESLPWDKRQRQLENRSRDSVISGVSDHFYEPIEGDNSFVSTHEWIPPLPPRNAPTVPQQSPAFGPKPDFLHSRNPFAKHGPPDPYVESGAVVGLNKKTFKKFIRDLDAAFVLFYNPCDKKCCSAKVSMRQAAHVTRKENHAFAAVDCSKDEELCKIEKVFSVPTMKLYVKGMTVDTYSHVALLPAEIRKFVENAPLVRETELEKSRCSLQ